MIIKAKRTNIEYLDVEVSKEDILKLIRNKLGFGTDSYVNEYNGIYYKYIGDNHHNGDPEYDEQKATDAEIKRWLAFVEIRKAFNKE